MNLYQNKPVKAHAVHGNLMSAATGQAEITKSSRNNSRETIQKTESKEILPPRNANTS
jgi:hypothetical protein